MLQKIIIDYALRTLPAHRADWGNAMKCEFEQIESSSEAFDFAIGCAWAAIQERTTVMNAITSVGRWGVGAVTVLYGAYFLWAAANCVGVLFGQQDPYYQMLIDHHHFDAAADHVKALPYILLFNLVMGVSNVAAALFLVRRNTKPFVIACAGVGMAGVTLTAIGLANGATLGTILTWAWPLVPLSMLVCAFCALAWISNRYAPTQAAA